MKTETASLLTDGSKGCRTIDFVPDMIGEGAMKEVYFTPDRKSVICFYKDAKAGSDPVRLQRLKNILGKYNPTKSRALGGAAYLSRNSLRC